MLSPQRAVEVKARAFRHDQSHPALVPPRPTAGRCPGVSWPLSWPLPPLPCFHMSASQDQGPLISEEAICVLWARRKLATNSPGTTILKPSPNGH